MSPTYAVDKTLVQGTTAKPQSFCKSGYRTARKPLCMKLYMDLINYQFRSLIPLIFNGGIGTDIKEETN